MSVRVAWQRALRRRPAGVERWIYCGEDAAWRLEARRGMLAGLDEVRTGHLREQWARELRQPYLDWIAELGVEHDSFDWWSSPLAAKNVYAHLFSRIVALGATLEVLEDGLLVVTSTPAAAAEVIDTARARGLVVAGRPGRNVRRQAFMPAWRAYQVLTPRRLPRMDPGDATTLLATWVDERSFAESGDYDDPHFGALPGMLRERGERVAFLARPLPHTPARAIARRLLATGETFLFPDAYLSAGDRRRARARSFGFAPRLEGATVGPVPVARLAQDLVEQERINHAEALSYDALVRNFAAAGARFKRVVLPWEGHAWEAALGAAVHEHLPGCAVIGYDNVNFSSLALSLYPGTGEIEARPLPDRVVTNGRTFADILRAAGFPDERVRVGCALRHRHIHEIEPREVPAGGFVLAAGSIDAAQTIELVETAWEAFGDELVVKLHPAVDAQRVRSAVRSPARYDDRPISTLLGEARSMLYTYSVVAYEALAAGVPPIFVRSETFLDLDQLEPTPEVRLHARTPEELRDADREAGRLGPEWRQRAREVVEAALAPAQPGCVDAFL